MFQYKKLVKLYISLALLLFAFVPNLIAQKTANGISINARVDTTSLLIGDQIELVLSAMHPADIDIKYPFLVDSIGKMEIVDYTKIDTVSIDNGLVKTQQKLMLTAWDSGQYVLPQFIFKYKEKNRNRTLRSQAIKINVTDLNAPLEDGIKPNKPIIAVPFTAKELIPYIIKGLIILALILLAGYFLFRFVTKKKEENTYVAPPLPAHEIALEKVQALKKTKMWQEDGQVKEFYSQLTDIIREYIEARYKFPALESTTDEIIVDLKKETDIPKGLRARMLSMFSMADLVKFAKAKPPNENHLQSIKDAEAFIQHTKLKEEKPAEQALAEEVAN